MVLSQATHQPDAAGMQACFQRSTSVGLNATTSQAQCIGCDRRTLLVSHCTVSYEMDWCGEQRLEFGLHVGDVEVADALGNRDEEVDVAAWASVSSGHRAKLSIT